MLNVLLALVVGAALAGASGDGSRVLEQFLQRDDRALTEYVALRRLEARNERYKAAARVEACTWLKPDGALAYRILSEEGSGQVVNRVLKKALEGEREASLRGEFERAALTPANYRFETTDLDAADAAADAVRVTLTPLRKDRVLVNGALILARSDGDLLRIEGRLARNPSLWTTRVDVIRTYARVAGVRVPMALESVASVRIAGRSTFRMTYDYLSINGQPVASDERCLEPHEGPPEEPVSVDFETNGGPYTSPF